MVHGQHGQGSAFYKPEGVSTWVVPGEENRDAPRRGKEAPAEAAASSRLLRPLFRGGGKSRLGKLLSAAVRARQGLRDALTVRPQKAVAGEAGDGQALARPPSSRPKARVLVFPCAHFPGKQ